MYIFIIRETNVHFIIPLNTKFLFISTKVNKTDVKGDKEEEVVKEDKEAKETQNVKEEEGVNDSVSMESMVW